ncbi:IclR family transcriptional regulator [Amycolatopsis sp. GM8]|uniref:IclR family transcriptional regulator n=1 Tax=Amycolatopsis sp. GM8 TaxID=2896530 RepID=UPI001F01A24E|nr:IclR family transcriptional regulator C-terminal domain-containing protein [Amycolatopsis sp. GM8]
MTLDAFEYHKPSYPIDSVDNALRAIHILRDFGSTRVSDVARILGVADSTAHRIMSMLVYQGFAVQDDQRRYCAGPAMSTPVIVSDWTRVTLELAYPVLDALAAELDENVCLAARLGVHTRVLFSVGPHDGDHVPERTGNVLLAHLSAAGRALLALLPEAQIENLYRGQAAEARGFSLSDTDYRILLDELEDTRQRGFSRCSETINRGISGIAVPVTSPHTPPVAIVVTTPPARLRGLYQDPRRLNRILQARDDVRAALASETTHAEQVSELIA